MTGLAAVTGLRRNVRLKSAVYRHRAFSRAGLSERFFALLFSGLVYPQIWEDPDVDIEAMALGEEHRIVAIASGGCNVLAYLARRPAAIDAVDLNPAHVALNRLKLAAAAHLPDHSAFLRFFSHRNDRGNAALYERYITAHLDPTTRAYWQRRDWRGRRRITTFSRDFYRTGLLGWCIGLAHLAARLHGVDPSAIMQARSLRQQRQFFEEELAPLFDKPLIRLATGCKASLFGLGIPPAQYDALAGEETMAQVLRARLEKLACQFPLKDNYFAWQAFARRFPAEGEAALPPYLAADSFAAISALCDRVAVHHASFTEHLAAKPAGSVDRYVLLDAQDWMTDAQLNALWGEITRTAAPSARVIFRTAGHDSILEGRVSPALLGQWRYQEDQSHSLTHRDRSAIYGGFHLYIKAGI